ncbi:uncharacterized protein LOC141794909 isoform X2 [Halichoeres trimaculatus]|uniref:uncharacterized protein LOC141794909 isoform X2 n=1 Tax=Halichoeres trimaculatus TaxID=147232 RepID=UPI003D9F31AE
MLPPCALLQPSAHYRCPTAGEEDRGSSERRRRTARRGCRCIARRARMLSNFFLKYQATSKSRENLQPADDSRGCVVAPVSRTDQRSCSAHICLILNFLPVRTGSIKLVESLHRAVEMERLLVLLGSLLLASFCKGQILCKENNCPHFTLMDKTEDYEERYYEATDWISTRIENNDPWAAHSRLKDYTKRQEERGFKLAVDAWPVLITERPDGRYMSWFLPPGTIKPENNDPYVKLESRPAGIIYVRIFGGTPSLETAEQNIELLQMALKKAMKDFDHNSYSGASFEPYLYSTHHNEVLIQAAKHD